MSDKLILVLLGIWAIIFGFEAVTNFKFVWMQPIEGIAALILGVVCLFTVFSKQPKA